MERQVEALQQLDVTESDAAQILGGNVRRLLQVA